MYYYNKVKSCRTLFVEIKIKPFKLVLFKYKNVK